MEEGCGAASGDILIKQSVPVSISATRTDDSRQTGESWFSRTDCLTVRATAVCEEDKLPLLLIMHNERRLQVDFARFRRHAHVFLSNKL